MKRRSWILLGSVLSFLLASASHAQIATNSEDTRSDTWIVCKKGKGNNEVIVNISDCHSLEGRQQAGFSCSGVGMGECESGPQTCEERGGTCVDPDGRICKGFLGGGCQPPCKCSIGGGGGGGGRCSKLISAVEVCAGAKPGSLSCLNAPFSFKGCSDQNLAANFCCEGGGGGGTKCEDDGTICKKILCEFPEVSICLNGKSVCCDPTSPGGGGGGRSCDPHLKQVCDPGVCPDGTRARKCEPDVSMCKGGIVYQCVDNGGGGGGGMCSYNPQGACVLCPMGQTCVDCTGGDLNETCQ